MKKYALPLALVAAVGLSACNDKASSPAPEQQAGGEVSLETPEQRLSYGIAFGLGQRMSTDGVPLDIDTFTAGLRDALEGREGRLTGEEIQAELVSSQQKMQAEQQAAQAALGEAN
ncbi:MAG: FKBP-type peptidyl-prolyl cis-trans isomerase N-terminal domain-containing protein, partial [Parahaliea sp.]